MGRVLPIACSVEGTVWMCNDLTRSLKWHFTDYCLMLHRRAAAMLRDRTLWLLVAILAGISGESRAEIPKPTDAPRPLPPEESAAQFQVPDGFRVELVASEPLISEPSGVCWDAQGRMFVCELHGYNLEGQYDIEELNKTGELDRVVRRIGANPSRRSRRPRPELMAP